MLQFELNRAGCIRCGECLMDCPSRIITVQNDGFPGISPEKEKSCIGCQHCLAVCPTGIISILGRNPKESTPLENAYPAPESLEILMKGRRSVRRFVDENVDPELIEKILDVAGHAPSGVNNRKVRFTVLDEKEQVAALRDEVMAGLMKLMKENAIPKRMIHYARFLKVWERTQMDIIFRNAPHMVIASAPKDIPCPKEDCLIALTWFELYAQACGVGTLWNGLAKWAIDELLPETRAKLGIPEDHVFGYALSFGKPAVRYFRTVQHGPVEINRPFKA